MNKILSESEMRHFLAGKLAGAKPRIRLLNIGVDGIMWSCEGAHVGAIGLTPSHAYDVCLLRRIEEKRMREKWGGERQ